jgi:hypothetical protein
VIGGHATNASMFDTYAATVYTENIRLLFYLIVYNNIDILTEDFGTAYVNASTEEKTYSSAGEKFDNKKEYKVVLKKALYGLKTSVHAWLHHFSGTLRNMGFKQYKLDCGILYRLRDNKINMILLHIM